MEEKGVAPKGFYHFMVNKFLIQDTPLSKKGWPREIKIAKKIFSQYPSPKFWNELDLGFSLKSLAWFLSENGRCALKVHRKILSFELKNKKRYKLSKKIGKNKKIKKTRKTLMDFLNESKKN